jgi:hypothetical protein
MQHSNLWSQAKQPCAVAAVLLMQIADEFDSRAAMLLLSCGCCCCPPLLDLALLQQANLSC